MTQIRFCGPGGRDATGYGRQDACRADPCRRYKSADEMMTVLLAFQFSHYNPRLENACQRLIRVISVADPYIGFGVIVGMLWRLIWLLKHTHH